MVFGFLKKVTGGTAKVSLTVGSAQRGGKAAVTVDVAVGAEAINPRRIYVRLRCTEAVDIPKYELPKEIGSTPAAPNEKPKIVQVKKEESLFEKEYTIAPSQSLAADSNRRFAGEIDFPAHLPPTFQGKLARIKWESQAGLDTSWTNPDSPWQEVAVV